MRFFDKLLGKQTSSNEEKTFKLDSLGLIFPYNDYEIFRPKFVVMDYNGGRYDIYNYRYLNGKRCKKHWKKIAPGCGSVYVPTYYPKRYLDIIKDYLDRCYSVNVPYLAKEFKLDRCPLYFYIQKQLEENPKLNIRELQIPFKVIQETYTFFEERAYVYNSKKNEYLGDAFKKN